MTNVPFIQLQKLTSQISVDVLKDWETCLKQTQFVGGEFVTRLEARMKELLGAPEFVSCANGTDALMIGLQALGIQPGMKVAVPNLTFWATYEAVVQVGAVPVLVDIDPDDLQMSFDEFKRAHEKFRFEGAILAHLFGGCSLRLEEYRAFCRERAIALLEDGAQSFGVRLAGKSVYAGARMSTLSFYPAKVIGGAMDGGGIGCEDKAMSDSVRSLCNHGRKTHYSYSRVGWNSRMGGLQAAFLLRICEKTGEILESRRKAVALYSELLSGARDRVRFWTPDRAIEGNGYLAVCLLEKAVPAEVVARLTAAGIGTGRVYPETIDQQEPARGALRVSELQHSRRFCERVLNLPLFAGITADEVRASAQALLSAI